MADPFFKRRPPERAISAVEIGERTEIVKEQLIRSNPPL
jgi:hypothetical protein